MPVQRTHREIVLLTLAPGQLLFEVIQGVELVYSIKLFIVFAMTAFRFCISNSTLTQVSPIRCYF